MIRRPPRSTRTDTLFPYTTLFRSDDAALLAAAKQYTLPSGRVIHWLAPDEMEMLAFTGVLPDPITAAVRSEEHTSELQSLMRISYAVFCLKKKKTTSTAHHN